MNDIENLTDEETAILEANFPPDRDLTDDERTAWLISARAAWDVASLEADLS